MTASDKSCRRLQTSSCGHRACLGDHSSNQAEAIVLTKANISQQFKILRLKMLISDLFTSNGSPNVHRPSTWVQNASAALLIKSVLNDQFNLRCVLVKHKALHPAQMN